MPRFHSAVNRIPVLRDTARRFAERGKLPAEVFADGQASGHDALEDDRWSGSIDLRLTAMTPIVCGLQEPSETGNEAAIIRLQRDKDGSVVVPPTMIKGMLSQAYESLTASRFRVFEDRPERLTYRADAAEALRLVPLRVTGVREDGGLDAELLLGSEDWEWDRGSHLPPKKRYVPIMRAASIQLGNPNWGHAQLTLQGGDQRLEEMTGHGEKLTCHLTLCLHKSQRYAYWQVTHIAPEGQDPEPAFEINANVKELDYDDDVTGYVYRTAKDGDVPSAVFRRKHDERLFFSVDKNPPVPVVIPPDVADGYKAVANGYRAQRQDQEDRGVTRPDAYNRAADEARRGGDDGHPGLRPGDLAYAVLDAGNYRRHKVVLTGRTVTVRQVVPTMIGRRAYDVAPQELGDDQRVLPLTSRGEASPADRLFGYVVPRADKEAKGGDVAYRGRVSVGVVDTSSVVVRKGNRLLAPLLSPKPTSARRFLTDNKGGTPGSGAALPRHDYFTSGQLLGRAAYPVEREVLDAVNLPAAATTVHQSPGVEAPGPSVRLRVRSWLAAGSIMTCTLRVTGLSRQEVAALLWILDPSNLVPARERTKGAEGFLRMGLGKPLGLGVVKVEVPDGGVRISSGASLAQGYRSLQGCMGMEEVPGTLPSLSAQELRILDAMPWIKATQRAAYGYTDGFDVRYMWMEENKRNNMTDEGQPKPGGGVSPHDLKSDAPKPIDSDALPG